MAADLATYAMHGNAEKAESTGKLTMLSDCVRLHILPEHCSTASCQSFQCHECLIFQNQSHHWKAFRKLITDLIRTKNRLTKKAADTFRKCEKAGQSEEFGRFADF